MMMGKKTAPELRHLNYQNMFWLFMIGSVLGVILEG